MDALKIYKITFWSARGGKKGILYRSTRRFSIYNSAIGTIFNFQRAEPFLCWCAMVICAFSLRPVCREIHHFLPKPFCSKPKNGNSIATAHKRFRSINQRQQRIIGEQMRSESRTQCAGELYLSIFLDSLHFFHCSRDLCVSFVFVCVRLFWLLSAAPILASCKMALCVCHCAWAAFILPPAEQIRSSAVPAAHHTKHELFTTGHLYYYSFGCARCLVARFLSSRFFAAHNGRTQIVANDCAA